MKSIETRLKDLEGQLNPDNTKAIVLVLDEFDAVDAGYFGNIDEEGSYLAWRTQMVREENRYNPAKVYLYGFNERDVLAHLEEFKKSI